jgi:hypothetical protein
MEGGETCLETPEGKQVGKKGVSVIVPGGQPMKLSVPVLSSDGLWYWFYTTHRNRG